MVRLAPHRRRRDRAADAGFTLIETLVSLAIGGAVIAMLATVTSQWMRNWSRGSAELQRSQQLVTGLDAILADLSAAQFAPAGTTTKDIQFDGQERSVTFVRRPLAPEAAPGLELVRLAAATGKDGATLLRTRAPLPLDPDVQPAAVERDRTVVLRAPYGVQFAYAGDDEKWKTSWRKGPALPRRIRVRVVDQSTGRDVFPSLTASVRVTAPVQCTASQTAAQCDGASGKAGDRPPPPNPPGAALAADEKQGL